MNDENTQLILNAINKSISKLEHSNKKSFNEIKTRLDSLEEDSKYIKKRLTSLEKIVTRIEVVEGERIQIALEHASLSIEQHKSMMESLDKINSKLDNHELRIQILEEKVL